MRKLLVAFDGSDPSRRALKLAAEIARKMDSQIVLAYVVIPVRLPAEVALAVADDLDAQHRQYAQDLLRKIAAEVEPIVVEGRVLCGAPADKIAELARTEDVDLLVVGSHGRTAVSRAVLGSVSNKLVHMVEKPVLVVR